MNDIVRLVAAAGREILCAELADVAVEQSTTGDVIDADARQQYEQRIRDLQSDIDEAEGDNDYGRSYRLQVELDALIDHLTASLGRGRAVCAAAPTPSSAPAPPSPTECATPSGSWQDPPCPQSPPRPRDQHRDRSAATAPNNPLPGPSSRSGASGRAASQLSPVTSAQPSVGAMRTSNLLVTTSGVLAVALAVLISWRWRRLPTTNSPVEVLPSRRAAAADGLRVLAAGLGAATVAGLLVPGLGGRLLMRVLGATSAIAPRDGAPRPTRSSVRSPFGGTFGFIVFVGLVGPLFAALAVPADPASPAVDSVGGRAGVRADPPGAVRHERSAVARQRRLRDLAPTPARRGDDRGDGVALRGHVRRADVAPRAAAAHPGRRLAPPHALGRPGVAAAAAVRHYRGRVSRRAVGRVAVAWVSPSTASALGG